MFYAVLTKVITECSTNQLHMLTEVTTKHGHAVAIMGGFVAAFNYI
jgi:hypothetical protein